MGRPFCLKAEQEAESCLCFRPLAGQQAAGMDLVWKKYQVFSKAAERFLELVREHIARQEK